MKIPAQSTTRRPLSFPYRCLLLLLLVLGCEEEPKTEAVDDRPLLDSTVTTLATYHPILDARVRTDTLMLYDLKALIDDGLILDGDMPVIGEYVREHGGMENLDEATRALSYRQLIDRALLIDLSIGSADERCADCRDSILIALPGSNARAFLGMGEVALDSLIDRALTDDAIDTDYRVAPYDQPLDRSQWSQTLRSIFATRDDAYDPVLFGNTVIRLIDVKKDPNDYTYGDIMSAVDRIKEMPEFGRIEGYLERLEADSTAAR